MTEFIYNWTFSLNNPPANRTTITDENNSYLLALFSFLQAHGWTADGSSNGVAVSPTNNISSGSDLVCTSTTNTSRSWIILKSPEGIVAGLDGTYLGDQSRIWVVFSLEADVQPTPYNGYMITSWHKVKPTGGTITVTPTSTGQSRVTGTYVTRFGRASLSTTAYFHFAITDKGHFWSGITYRGYGVLQFVTVMFPVHNVQKYLGLDYPYAVLFHQEYNSGSMGPSLSNSPNFDGCWDFKLSAKTGYINVPRVNSLPVGSGTNGFTADGQLVQLEAWMTDINPVGGASVVIVGSIADFRFTGSSSLTFGTLNFERNLCSAGQWFLPVDQVLRA